MIARVARFLRRLKKKDLVGFKRTRAMTSPLPNERVWSIRL